MILMILLEMNISDITLVNDKKDIMFMIMYNSINDDLIV